MIGPTNAPDGRPTLPGWTAGQRVFNRFTLVQLLGRGGMGTVWLARDGTLGTDVALKFLNDSVRWDATAMVALRQETRRARQLTHPAIVRVHDFHEDGVGAAISMEYLSGGSLHHRRSARASPAYSCDEIAGWLPGLCAALDYAHAQGVVHRDLKPSNLLVAEDGLVKISDFGIAQPLFETSLRLSQWQPSGTLAYMSPQQHFGEPANTADDIYALGATLYDLLTGKPPFYSGNVAVQIERRNPDSITERRRQLGLDTVPIPHHWEETIAACLAKRPEDRPASATEIAARLTATRPKPTRPFVIHYITNRLGRIRSVRPVLWGTLALTLALAAWFFLPRRAREPATSAPVYASDASRAIAAWNLDGDGRDASGHGLHLTNENTVPTADRFGRIDRAMHFNGSAWMHSDSAPAFSWPRDQPFTVALWVRPDGSHLTDTMVISSLSARQGGHSWSLSLRDNRPTFYNGLMQVDNPDLVASSIALSAGSWTHVTAVNDGRALSIYVNGHETGRVALHGGLPVAEPEPEKASLTVGFFDKLDPNKFAGSLDELRLWHRALIPAEIEGLAASTASPLFALTQGRYAETEDLAAVAMREFGEKATLADWSQLRRWHSDDTQALADDLGLTTSLGAVFVQRDGSRLADEARRYFVNRFDGAKPDYFLAHDELGGMTLALGSWFGITSHALVVRPFVAPRIERCSASAGGDVVRVFPSDEKARVVAWRWHREFTREAVPQFSQVDLVLRDGRILRAVCRANGGQGFALAVGDAMQPQLSREIGVTYDNLEFTLVLRQGSMEFRAVSSIGAAPLFREKVVLAGFSPAEISRISLPGLDSAELTIEE